MYCLVLLNSFLLVFKPCLFDFHYYQLLNNHSRVSMYGVHGHWIHPSWWTHLAISCMFYMHKSTNMILHTMVFGTPDVMYWLDQEITQWV